MILLSIFLLTSAPTSPTAIAMCATGILVFLIALWFSRSEIASARGLDKIPALSNLCFAIPLAVFGALHLFGIEFVAQVVPTYMPWRIFWAYLVGVALLLASFSFATRKYLRWSGLLFGIMLLLFAAMTDLPAVFATPGDRYAWTYTLRELSFAAGGICLATAAMRTRHAAKLLTACRITIAIVAIVYAIEHFLHPAYCPGVPLEKIMPDWIPARPLIGYLTGLILLAAGVAILLAKKTRLAATILGGWIVLLVLCIYGPLLIVALADPNTGVQVDGLNYFADTLLFGAAILALASATPPSPANLSDHAEG
jgi:uncharacterized membrane protein